MVLCLMTHKRVPQVCQHQPSFLLSPLLAEIMSTHTWNKIYHVTLTAFPHKCRYEQVQFPKKTLIVDGQAYAWPFPVFTQEQVFVPRTAKS